MYICTGLNTLGVQNLAALNQLAAVTNPSPMSSIPGLNSSLSGQCYCVPVRAIGFNEAPFDIHKKQDSATGVCIGSSPLQM